MFISTDNPTVEKFNQNPNANAYDMSSAVLQTVFESVSSNANKEINFKEMFESLSVIFYVVNLDPVYKLEYVSPAFECLGYTLEEIYAHPRIFDLVIHPDDLLMIKEANKPIYDGKIKQSNYTYRVFTKGGEMRRWKDHGRPIFNENGERVKWFGVIYDITETIKTREELEKSNRRLRQSNRELQDFAYVASHDLQEPLRKVQAFGDRLQKKFAGQLNEEGGDYIRRMRDAAGRMQRLINDLLTFSRVSSKAQPFQLTDIRQIAEEVVSDLEVRIEQTNAEVEIGDLPAIDADAVQMRQLLQNLIGNALKFHRADETPLIKIYADAPEPTGGSFTLEGEQIQTVGNSDQTCTIVVEDNGIGFEEKYLEKIFTVFQRLHGRTDYEGSGIGLAVCRKIAERHNGSITARSALGKGSTFFITLPIAQTNEEINFSE